MNWYYVEQGQQAGPVSEEQLGEMLRGGKIQPDTLVWREGLAEWTPCRSALGGTPSDSTTGATGEPTAEAVCAECGKMFPVEETIRYGNARVCAACKPVFLQKLQEGAPVNTGELRYARILTRFSAVVLDGLILMVVNMALGFLLGYISAIAARHNPSAIVSVQFVLLALEVAVAASYETLMVGKYGATLGKMACKIKVVIADGGRVSYLRSCGRYFGKMLSSLTCLIGYIIAIFDNPQKRALHDHLCNTRVIYR
ncbi:MAG: RDD family protein [Verrucomicrobia bacterium]|nr:RDD family protein [Verrucomicrobiota bacterium]MDE3099202.1 RDD family protein [Verrucomicrobiota bacterium]